MRIADCGFIGDCVIEDCGLMNPRSQIQSATQNQKSTINPQSQLRIDSQIHNQSAIRNPQSAITSLPWPPDYRR
jgi:bifunctional N-acetylglucosamine-1-phosphate-uridyltransferase/glucosamine-1-phosphate-acetyltransferase GlmU-like protein